ncbi:U-box domain-containing protein 33 [Spatholobus suberectus]|nr:U-box domain-containing protein 33 [Spatholobus suberectus]
MGSIVEGAAVSGVEDTDTDTDTVYVAVGKNAEKTQQLLHWAVKNFSGKNICLLHIHQPHSLNSFTDRNPSGYEPKDRAIKAFQEHGNQMVHELLDQYILTLVPAGVRAYKLLIEMDDIEKGITKAIDQHNIKWLVMGAATDRYNLGVYGRHTSDIEATPTLLVLNSNTEAKQSETIKSESIPDALKYLDSDDMEEIKSVSSHRSFYSKWSFNNVMDMPKLTDLMFHEVRSSDTLPSSPASLSSLCIRQFRMKH